MENPAEARYEPDAAAVKEFAITLPANVCHCPIRRTDFPAEPVRFQCRQSGDSIVAWTADDVDIKIHGYSAFRAQLAYRRVAVTWWAMPEYSATGYSLTDCKRRYRTAPTKRVRQESLKARDCLVYPPLSKAVKAILQKMQDDGELL